MSCASTLGFLHLVATVVLSVFAQSTTAAAGSRCSSPPSSATYAAPSIAPGYKAQIIAGDLTYPRGLKFDPEGHLLVVDVGKGVLSLTLEEDGDCISVTQKKTVISNKHVRIPYDLEKKRQTPRVFTDGNSCRMGSRSLRTAKLFMPPRQRHCGPGIMTLRSQKRLRRVGN